MSDSVVVVWTLGDRLAKARRTAGVGREEMADYLGVSAQAISNYENDRRIPKLGVLRLWALQTGVSLDWLRYGDSLPRPEVVGRKKGSPSPSTTWYGQAA